MNEAKVQFSAEELLLAENAAWILTKNVIIRKICELFGGLADQMQIEVKPSSLPWEIIQTTPKISKGENYRGLPYVVLDYPRLFTKENVFAVRTLFWWAHYFTITLHLKGKYKETFLEQIRKNISFFSAHGFYVSTSANEWIHALHEDDYTPLMQVNADLLEENFVRNNFLKLSAKIDLRQWNQAEEMLLQLFRLIITNLKTNVKM